MIGKIYRRHIRPRLSRPAIRPGAFVTYQLHNFDGTVETQLASVDRIEDDRAIVVVYGDELSIPVALLMPADD